MDISPLNLLLLALVNLAEKRHFLALLPLLSHFRPRPGLLAQWSLGAVLLVGELMAN